MAPRPSGGHESLIACFVSIPDRGARRPPSDIFSQFTGLGAHVLGGGWRAARHTLHIDYADLNWRHCVFKLVVFQLIRRCVCAGGPWRGGAAGRGGMLLGSGAGVVHLVPLGDAPQRTAIVGCRVSADPTSPGVHPRTGCPRRHRHRRVRSGGRHCSLPRQWPGREQPLPAPRRQPERSAVP